MRVATFAPIVCALATACSTVFVEAGPSSSGTEGGGGSSSIGSGNGSGGALLAATVGPSGVGSVASSSGASSSSGKEPITCSSFGDPCTSCIATSCADTWCACQGNAECFALLQCSGGCQDSTGCFEKCMALHPDGIADVLLVSGCAGTVCDAVCKWGSTDFDPCGECVFKGCASETNACFGDPTCFALWKCFDACGPSSLSCHQSCYVKHPDGVTKLDALFTCANSSCENICN